MMFNDILYLITASETEDADGYVTTTETKNQVYCRVASVQRTEYYEAKKSGLELAIVFEIWNDAYSGQKNVEYNGTRYQVERTYTKDRMILQLNCSEVVK